MPSETMRLPRDMQRAKAFIRSVPLKPLSEYRFRGVPLTEFDEPDRTRILQYMIGKLADDLPTAKSEI